MKQRERVARAKSARSTTPVRLLADGQQHMAPWRTLISLHQMHEDLALHTYARVPVTVLLEIALESDFADLFEVRYRSWQRRADLNTWWLGPNSLESRYQNQDFVRRCLIRTLTEAAGVADADRALPIPIHPVP